MASLFNSKHNKYVSIPDWFKDTDLSVQQTVEHKTTYIGGGGGAINTASGLSNVVLYNKFVIEDAELDKEALTIVDTVLNTVESETAKLGDTISLSGWSTTDYISIAGGSVMVVTSYIDTELNKLYGILFYDNTRSVIGSHLLTSSPEEVSVPAGAFYFRISTTVTDDFKIVYKVSKEYNEDQLLQSNNNVTNYLSLNELIPEGINETSVTDNALKLLVQSPLALTRDLNNVIKLSMKQVNGSNINDMFVWDKKLAAFGYDEVSKQAYSYVDGQQQFDVDGNPVMTNNPDFWMYDENLEDRWIIKSTRSRLSWLDNLFEYDDKKNCFVLHGNLATTGGIVTYANAGDINIDNIYDGLPIDWDTIYWEEGVLKSKSNGSGIKEVIVNGNGNALTGVYWNGEANTMSFNKDKTFAELQYVQDNFLLKNEIDGKLEQYVTINTEQTITGKKDFTTGGLFVNGNQIVYDDTNGYWLLEGDLLVTGGITSFASASEFEPSSIMDALRVDGENLKVMNGVLTFVGSTGGGGGTADSVHWGNIEGKPTWIGESKPSYSWSEITGKPNFVTEEDLEEEGFLTAMDIQVLTFTNGAFKAVSYDPSMAPKTVNIPTKLSHLEDDSDFVTSGMLSSYATKTWVGQQGFATEDWVDENYFSINGGQLHGDLWLRSGTESYGRRIIFGDVRTSNGQPYVYIGEDTDDDLTIASWGDFRIKVGDGAYLTYIKDDGYWEITGDLLVTGGITSYS